jgi:hypothetical protein
MDKVVLHEVKTTSTLSPLTGATCRVVCNEQGTVDVGATLQWIRGLHPELPQLVLLLVFDTADLVRRIGAKCKLDEEQIETVCWFWSHFKTTPPMTIADPIPLTNDKSVKYKLN